MNYDEMKKKVIGKTIVEMKEIDDLDGFFGRDLSDDPWDWSPIVVTFADGTTMLTGFLQIPDSGCLTSSYIINDEK